MGRPYELDTEDDPADAVAPVKADAVPRRTHAPPARGGQSMLDDVANDLALWIDKTATEVALAFAPARAPFSANITEDQKLQFYKSQIFNPDGSPNQQGRQQEIARLGPEGFGQVYKAVVARWPELKPPPPQPITVPDEWPTMPAPMPGPPGTPPGLPPGPPGPPPMMPLPPGGP